MNGKLKICLPETQRVSRLNYEQYCFHHKMSVMQALLDVVKVEVGVDYALFIEF